MSRKDDTDDVSWADAFSPMPPLNKNLSSPPKPNQLQPRHHTHKDNDTPVIIPPHLPVKGEDAIQYTKNHLPTKLMRDFKRGKLNPMYRLDLHQQTIDAAVSQTSQAIQHCQDHHIRVLHIIHGKNLIEGCAKLKSSLNAWLPKQPCVLAFTSAPPSLGGTGALLCLIKQTTGHHHD
jgi:DNA-nicking Smr family endonuclease